MVYIIGSGLSAVAAAVALTHRGLRPTIIDAGGQLDKEAQDLKARLSATMPDFWKATDLLQLRRTGPAAVNGIPRKLCFASNFAFEEIKYAMPLDITRASVYRSFAAGGFSNVWGAVIHPLDLRDMRGWPISPTEMSQHYTAAHDMMRDAACDGLTAEQLSTEGADSELQPSSQARTFHADLASAGERLSRNGIRFDYPRLAVLSAGRDGRKGCLYCGQCVYGCPYDSIYTAPITLARLIREGRVDYRPGIVIDKLSHSEGEVLIEGRSIKDGTTCQFRGRTVFVAAGLLETARIILTSLELYGRPIQVKHSEIFTLPLVRYRAASDVFQERLHSLCQIVIEVEDPTICPDYVRLQLYGYNELYSRLLEQKTGRLAPLLRPAVRALAARLFVAFGYLHSDVSSGVSMTLIRADKPRLQVTGTPNPKAKQICRAISRKLFQNRECLRAIPLHFQLRLDLPGGGYHSGASFPMRRTPQGLETDVWGSLPSLRGVHIVDASVLPSVPASPIAFTVMANAHRIASRCPLPDES
jgi:choline dehydrogenase-like flavoprotein